MNESESLSRLTEGDFCAIISTRGNVAERSKAGAWRAS